MTVSALLSCAVVAARVVEQGEAALARDENDVILRETEQIIERNLQLGLPLSELQQVDPLIERVLASSPDIAAVDVFSPQGVTLFSTDRGAVGEPVPAAWLTAMETSRREGGWRAEESDTVTLGRPLINDFGQVEGWLSLIVSRDALTAPLSRVPGFVLETLPFALLGGLLAALAGAALLPRADRRLATVTAALAERKATAGGADALGRTVDAAVKRTQEAEAELAAAEARMMRLDAEV
jgi:hypothetical protein